MGKTEKKIILINQNTGYLTIDIANAFTTRYEKVVLMTGFVRKMERDLLPAISIQRMVRYNRESTVKRLWTWFWGSTQVFFALLFKYRDFEVVYFTNPPMAYLSSLFLPNRFSVVVYDTYPDALKTVGIKENNLFYKLWASANKKIFAKVKKVITLSEGMAEQLGLYVEASKIQVIPNWPGSGQFKQVPRSTNIFALEHNLSEKFVVMYSGNMGYTHNVESIIDLAIEMRQEKDISFVLIGEGQKKDLLKSLVKKHDLSNVLFFPWQPSEILPYSLATADVAVVTIDISSSLLSVPSKTYNILATGSPMLCIAPDNSEIAKLAQIYDCGKSFSKEDITGMKDFILDLKQNPDKRQEYSSNALAASVNFVKENAFQYL